MSQEKSDKTAPLLCADGLFTCCERKALTIRTADCQAILFAHTKGKFIAAIHVGWRGNLKKFPQTAVEFLCKKYTVKASEIMAVRGPSLGPGASEFSNFEKEWPVEYCPWFDTETKLLDLWGITRYQLEMSGIMEENIFSIDMCTKSLPEVFFSHRNGHTERQVAAIWIDRNRPQC